MDDIVRQAIAKWPHVPSCYGWLGLDARGNWYLRDDLAQAAGPFVISISEVSHSISKGSQLLHDKLIDFIGRNYASDESGQWFFQNGPQRVYVELEATPLIWRIRMDFNNAVNEGEPWFLADHTGRNANFKNCFLDEAGRLYLKTDLGFGLLHSQDVIYAADIIEQGLWVPEELLVADLPNRFGYILSPKARHGKI